MSVLPVGFGSSGGYEIQKSLRFRDSNSAYLSRTPSSTGNRKTWTWSGWVKRGRLGSTNTMFGQSTGATANGYGALRFYVESIEFFASPNGATSSIQWASTAVFRDPSSHYHVVVVLDTTQATGADRLKVFVNGSQLAGTFGTTPTLNADIEINRAAAHQIGAANTSGLSSHLDGYLSEINFIDGQALTPASFGETNADGVWVPKKYTGTYGTNGFYLPFDDGTSATTLGYDRSGNGNNWTASGISTTAGATYDWMEDTPTNNYAVLNPLQKRWAVALETFSAGNLTVTSTSASSDYCFGSMAVESGKWYWEVTITNAGSASTTRAVGVDGGKLQSSVPTDVVFYIGDGTKSIAGSASAYGATYTTNDVIGVALDKDAGTVTFYKNNASQGAITLPTSVPLVAANAPGTSTGVHDFNFGQRPFAYTPPAGFKALCTKNRPAGGSVTTSGSFTGNANADGPFVWLNGNPETMTINGNAVTWGTHADKTAGGFKVRTSSTSYNASGTNTYSVTSTGKLFGDIIHEPNNAKGNP